MVFLLIGTMESGRIKVKFLEDFGDKNSGDTDRLDDWKAEKLVEEGIAKVDYEKSLIELAEESEKIINEERMRNSLTELDQGIYGKMKFYLDLIDKDPNVNLFSNESLARKFSKVEKNYKMIKELRVQKILKAAREDRDIFDDLTRSEKQLYNGISRLVREWLNKK